MFGRFGDMALFLPEVYVSRYPFRINSSLTMTGPRSFTKQSMTRIFFFGSVELFAASVKIYFVKEGERKDGFSADALPLIVCIWSPRRACGWREKGITLDIYNMKHLWRHFPGTQNLGITIGGMAPNEFTAKIFLHIKGYSDAPLANNLDTRRSTAGHVVILAGGAVLWQLKKRLSSHPAPRRLNLLIRLQMVY